MTRFMTAALLAAALASPALAFDPQPDPPSQQNQVAASQPQAKAAKANTHQYQGRTLADYNIQKE